MSKTAVIFVHHQGEGSCIFGRILNELGFEVRTIRVPVYGLEGFDPLAPDLLMIMGGAIGVYQAEDYPFVYHELDAIRARVKADKPTLGICLGAQMIAKALGAEVYRGAQGKEAGWSELAITEEGYKTPVRHLGREYTRILQWHNDTFDFPEGARLLATTEKYKHQAFVYGRNILGLQCHPEVTKERLREWCVGLVDQLTGDKPLIPLKDFRAQNDLYIDKAEMQSRKFFLEWLEESGL